MALNSGPGSSPVPPRAVLKATTPFSEGVPFAGHTASEAAHEHVHLSLNLIIFTSEDQLIMQTVLLLLEANDLLPLFVVFCRLFVQVLFTTRGGKGLE